MFVTNSSRVVCAGKHNLHKPQLLKFCLGFANVLFFGLISSFLQRAVFQGLSQEALSACIHSLLGAADSISKNKVRVCALGDRVVFLLF